MNALQFCQEYIKFNRTSDITGSFQIDRYRFLEKPLLDLSNPTIRRMVVYAASGCMKTVFLECGLAYRIAREQGDIQCVAQTDDAAGEWTETRGKDFILRIPCVDSLIPRNGDRQRNYAITKSLWQFVHKWVAITGPSVSEQNKRQVRYLFTDEGHLKEHYADGSIGAFEQRMGDKWNRAALHVSTAADKGREIDKFYHDGQQNEFFLRCLNCNQLYWPLWEDDAKDYYNGTKVFQWQDKQSDTMTLESLREICPHCSHEHLDTAQVRHELQTNGDYSPQNRNALKGNQSYRWSCFAFFSIKRRDILARYLSALRAERMGDLSVMEEFIKKKTAMSYTPTLHNLGETTSGRDYKTGDVWIVDEKLLRVGSFDVQSEGGFHLWAQCDDFRADGSSRRVAYTRLESWSQARQFQLDHNIESEHVGIDTQHRHSETLGKCAEWLWYGMRASDDREFTHKVNGLPVPNRFYGECTNEDALQGKLVAPDVARYRKRTHHPVIKLRDGTVAHTGFCFVRAWSKQNVGMLLMRLKSGESGRYFGIASDLTEDFTEQLHSYIETRETHKKTGAESVILKQIKHHDHAFSCQSQSIVLAMVAGYYPLA